MLSEDLNFELSETDEIQETGDKTEVFLCECEARLDALLSEKSGLSRSLSQKLIEGGGVSVNGRVVLHKSTKLKVADEVKYIIPEPCEYEVTPENIPLDIVYEDNDLLVVNKAKGMVVHPAPGNYDGTLVNALMYHCKASLSGINGVMRPGILHRIDKDTSGLLVVAKNDNAHVKLAQQIKEHSFTRVYNALTMGVPKNETGTVNAPIGRNPNDRKKMCVIAQNSKEAITHYRVLEDFGKYALCEMKLETGRTHQIRVHMSHIGYPIVGDMLYAPKNGQNQFGISGQALHAKVLGFVHPGNGKYMEFSSDLPKYFCDVLTKLRKSN